MTKRKHIDECELCGGPIEATEEDGVCIGCKEQAIEDEEELDRPNIPRHLKNTGSIPLSPDDREEAEDLS